MSEMKLDGLSSREAESGEGKYHLFQLTSPNLSRLSDLIYSHSNVPSWQVEIGQGNLRFETVSDNIFTAKALSYSDVLLRANSNELKQLAKRLYEMAYAETDPDYIIHSHLDTHFTKAGEGLSDVIFQRLDEYHH